MVDRKAPAEPRPGFIAVGRIIAPHGVHGDVRIQPLTDFAERFRKGAVLHFGGGAHTVATGRPHNDEFLVRFEDIPTPEAAAVFRDQLLEIPESEATPLPPGEYYRWQIEGMEAVTRDGQHVGTVREVLETGANDVLVIVDDAGAESLVPLIDEFATVDGESRRVVVTPIPGMLAGTDAS